LGGEDEVSSGGCERSQLAKLMDYEELAEDQNLPNSSQEKSQMKDPRWDCYEVEIKTQYEKRPLTMESLYLEKQRPYLKSDC
jgi:hypothetical protein